MVDIGWSGFSVNIAILTCYGQLRMLGGMLINGDPFIELLKLNTTPGAVDCGNRVCSVVDCSASSLCMCRVATCRFCQDTASMLELNMQAFCCPPYGQPNDQARPVLPHSQRTCLRCSSTVVDDEAHCLFMCEHPTIVEARDLFLAAVVPPVAALSSLRYADFWALSATGCVPLSALVKYVAVCVRVCRSCHLSGGTDVVNLPDILLPAGQYLDLFDSESETDHSGGSSDEELVEV